MNDDSPPGPMPAEDTPAGRRTSTGQVIGGAVLGFIASWLLALIIGFALYTTYGDSNSIWLSVAIYGALALPAIISVALLVPSRTRYWGAGLLIGVAIGSVLGAGVCVGVGQVLGSG